LYKEKKKKFVLRRQCLYPGDGARRAGMGVRKERKKRGIKGFFGDKICG